MGDQTLRERERDVQRGDPAAAVAAAIALLRAGRRDEAFDLLWPVRQDPAARAELLRFPAWTQSDGDAGHTRSIDAPVPRTEPRVRWAVTLAGGPHDFFGPLLVGAPGVVVPRETSTRLVDHDGGEAIGELRGIALWLDGDRVLVRARRDVAWVRCDGAATWPEPPIGGLRGDGALHPHAGRVAQTLERELLVLRLDGDRAVQLWSRATEARRTSTVAAFARDLVFVKELSPRTSKVHALDAETGANRFTIGSGKLLADAHGVVNVDPKAGLVARDLAGDERWSTGYVDRLLPEAIDAAHVVSNLGDVLDRATGAVRARLGVQHASWLLARDVVVCWSHAPSEDPRCPVLAAFTTTGEPLWRMTWPDRRVHDLATFGGRLYAHTTDVNTLPGYGTDRLLCLEA